MGETNGNVAAMREALKSVAAWLLERFGNPADPDHDKAEGFYILTTGVLAAPARNCDRFATAGEAHIAFQRFCHGNYRPSYAAAGLDGCDDCELCEAKNESGGDACPFVWLFSTEEREGGAE